MKYIISKKIIVISIIIFIIFSIILINFVNTKKIEVISKIENRLEILSNKINHANNNYEKNITELQRLQNGTELGLYNPSYEAAIGLIQNNTKENLNDLIYYLKGINIRCALAILEVSIIDDLYMKKLIAFETSYNELIYFEMESGFQVEPVVGKNYSSCVLNESYNNNLYNIISDILLIW